MKTVLDTFSRCTTRFRLFMSSTGNASDGFYQIMTAKQASVENLFGCDPAIAPMSIPR